MLECHKCCPFGYHDEWYTKEWCGFSSTVEDLLDKLPVAWWDAYLDCPWLEMVA